MAPHNLFKYLSEEQFYSIIRQNTQKEVHFRVPYKSSARKMKKRKANCIIRCSLSNVCMEMNDFHKIGEITNENCKNYSLLICLTKFCFEF